MVEQKRLKEKSIYFILFCFVWIMIFNPPIISVFNLLHILGGISIIYFISQKRISMYILRLEIYVLAIFIYIIVVSMINNQMDIMNSYLIWWIIDIIPLAAMIADLCKRYKIRYACFELIIIMAGVFASSLALLSVINEDIHQAFLNALIKAGHSESYIVRWGFRMHGFASNLTYSSPIALALIALLALKRMVFSNRFLYLILSLFMAVMGYVSARTSIVVYMVGGLLLLLVNVKKIGRIGKTILFLCMFVAIGFISLSIYVSSAEYNEQIYWLYDGLANIFSLFSENVNTINDSLEYFSLKGSKYILPSEIGHLIFGTGEFIMADNSQGVYSDIGYINDIWFGGIFYSIIMYMSTGFVLSGIKRKMNTQLSVEGKSIAMIVLGTLLVANVKGIIIGFNDVTSLIFLIYIYLIVNGGQLSDE